MMLSPLDDGRLLVVLQIDHSRVAGGSLGERGLRGPGPLTCRPSSRPEATTALGGTGRSSRSSKQPVTSSTITGATRSWATLAGVHDTTD